MIKPKILTEIEKIPGIESQLNDKAKQVDVNNALALKRDKSIPIDLTDFTDAAKQAIAGTASIYPSFADKSVTPTKATFFQTGKNKFNKKAATVGYYVNQTTGELAANAGHTVSDWILIELNTEYIPSISCRYAFYDSAKIFISGGYPATGTSFTSPANAKYLRVSYENVTSTLDTFQVEKGNVRTYYENYIEYIPLDYIEKTEDKYVEKLTYSIGSEDISTATYPVITSGGITRVDGNPCNGDGFLKSITFRANAVGSIKIKLFSKNGSKFTMEKEFSLTTVASLKTYVSGIDFATNIEIKKDWLIGFYTPGGGANIPFNSTAQTDSYYIADVDITGVSTSLNSANYHILIRATIEADMNYLNSKIPVDLKPTTLIVSEKFKATALPKNFINNGFTINDGAISPTTGGWDKNLYYDSYTTLDEATVRARVKINDANCNFVLMKRDKYNIVSMIGQVDCVNKKLCIREPWNNNISAIPNPIVEGGITFNFVVGREYLVELHRKTIKVTTLRITDTITGDFAELTNDYDITAKRPVGWGSPCITAISGNFTVTKFEYASDQLSQPKLAIYGDSFVEGDSMLPYGHSNRYASKVKTKLNGNCTICGRGGENSAGLLQKFDDDFMHFKPKYTLLAIGTNDTDYNIWLANIQALITKVMSRSSIPILMTLTKRTDADYTTYMTSVNNWILSSGYKFVDVNLATTINQDRLTQDATMFLGDGIHPNVAGHTVIFNKICVDVPEVFDFD